MIANCCFLVCCWCFSERDLDNCQESFLFDAYESLFLGLIDINYFLLGDGDDLVQPGHLSADDFSDPQGTINYPLGGLNGHEILILSKEERECSRDILA